LQAIQNSEESRYGRDKLLSVDHTYIESGEFRRKFDEISGNKELNRNLYQTAKTMLKHRSGTEFEDMYWLDAVSGRIVTQITDMSVPNKVVYSQEFIEKYNEIKEKVTIHNHPRSMPPSIGDFESAYRNGYNKGVVVCHDGKVFVYENIKEPIREIYDAVINNYLGSGYSDYTAQIMTLAEMSNRGILKMKEVIYNEHLRR
jgi:hypothetical protein